MKALYIHIPFCRKLCPFCSFPVLVQNQPRKKQYISLLLQEIDLWKEELRQITLDSVYIGGGTPSSLTKEEWELVFTRLRERTNLANNVEISFEMNPEDARIDYLEFLLRNGVNRLSIGVQSLQDTGLQRLGRNHTVAMSKQAITLARQAGFTNINLDFMYAYKDQTSEEACSDFLRFTQYDVQHLSLYWLSLEGKTKYARKLDWQAWQERQEASYIETYVKLVEFAKQYGFIQYEVSNFAKENKYSRQNELVWRGDSFLAVGLGAHGYWKGRRFANTRLFPLYASLLQQNKRPLDFSDLLQEENKRDETFLMGFRTKIGFMWDPYFVSLPKQEQEKAKVLLQTWEKQGLLTYEKGRISPTAQGFLLADQMALELSLLFTD